MSASITDIQNELSAAKAEAAARVHRLERSIDLCKQIEDAEARITRRNAKNADDQASVAALSDELAALQ